MSDNLRTLALICICGIGSPLVFAGASEGPAKTSKPEAGNPAQAGSGKSTQEQSGQGPVSLTVSGISVQADDDAPRVLNILPWQQPTISKRTRSPLPLDAPALLEPVQPEALRRHRTFRRTLDPLAE